MRVKVKSEEEVRKIYEQLECYAEIQFYERGGLLKFRYKDFDDLEWGLFPEIKRAGQFVDAKEIAYEDFKALERMDDYWMDDYWIDEIFTGPWYSIKFEGEEEFIPVCLTCGLKEKLDAILNES